MKKIPLILIALISFSCSQKNRSDQALAENPDTTNNFDWIIGSWLRSNDKEGNITFEHWAKNSSTEYIGLGCTL